MVQESPDKARDKGPLLVLVFAAVVLLPEPGLAAGTGVVDGFCVADGVGAGVVPGDGDFGVLWSLVEDELLPSVKIIYFPSDEVEKAYTGFVVVSTTTLALLGSDIFAMRI